MCQTNVNPFLVEKPLNHMLVTCGYTVMSWIHLIYSLLHS